MKGISSLKHIQFALPGNSHVHPVRDWFLLLGFTAVLLGVAVGFGGWNYVGALRASEQNTPVGAKPVFDTTAVEAVRAAFDARTQEATRYSSEYRFVDPSR